MTYARKTLVSLQETPYYHVVSRCVRRAWLWGFDEYAGRDYSHRKEWVLDRLSFLSSMFALDICAYAVMSNHYHLVLYVDAAKAHGWTQREVVERWTQEFSCPRLIKRWLDGKCQGEEQMAAESVIETWRSRLCDLSWYMRCLNEHLARRANAEDNCKGRFWEGRFKSQALLDEAGLLTAMAYVDLNPVRAGVALTPETSDFTSIYARIVSMHEASIARSDAPKFPPLRSFRSSAASPDGAIPFTFEHYLELLDWTGRRPNADRRGVIDAQIPPIMRLLSVGPDVWVSMMQPRGNAFGRAIARVERLRLHARVMGQRWVRGMRLSSRLYAAGASA